MKLFLILLMAFLLIGCSKPLDDTVPDTPPQGGGCAASDYSAPESQCTPTEYGQDCILKPSL